ncbi:hypothetical protein THF1C08_20113 [Vibrio jasicida]|uniref:Uncharacterized protein n=1 Tax=Vibrio jasicida TaxID=766224 RepID=A0AAU9QJ14_9VIBR|nr:hypothetical protein THF1C08_20113 [Vibrio jasicida]CAH1584790.1 hypothetical protein THF1A12_20114 [Vibrio jasicida]
MLLTTLFYKVFTHNNPTTIVDNLNIYAHSCLNSITRKMHVRF